MSPFLRSIPCIAVASIVAGCQQPAPPAIPAPSTSTTPAKRAWSGDTEEAWRALTTVLPGPWRATTADGTVEATYRLISNGSALVESFTTAGGKETITVYHREGGELVLTHYCGQGNQATLRAEKATPANVSFSFASATNTAPSQDVLQSLAIDLKESAFDQRTVYRAAAGSLETTTLHFVRVDPKEIAAKEAQAHPPQPAPPRGPSEEETTCGELALRRRGLEAGGMGKRHPETILVERGLRACPDPSPTPHQCQAVLALWEELSRDHGARDPIVVIQSAKLALCRETYSPGPDFVPSAPPRKK